MLGYLFFFYGSRFTFYFLLLFTVLLFIPPDVLGNIPPQPHHLAAIATLVGLILQERVETVAGPLQVGFHPRKVTPSLCVLGADEPAQTTSDDLFPASVSQQACHDHQGAGAVHSVVHVLAVPRAVW